MQSLWTWLTRASATLLLGASLIGHTSAPALAADQVILRMGSPLSNTDLFFRSASRLRDQVKERTNGEVDIQLFFGNQLGDHATMMENIQMGALEMLNSFSPIWENVEPSFKAVNLPYVLQDFDHVDKVFDGPIGERYEALLLERNVRVLASLPSSFRQILSTRPIRSLDDLNGMKLRSVTAATYIDTFKLLGANPVPISSKEVYMAVRSGLVEGMEAPLSILLGWKMYEVGEYVAITNHIYNHGYFLINEDVFQSLSPAQQEALTESAREVTDWHRVENRKVEAEAEAELERRGVTVTHPDLAPFQSAVEPIYEKYATSADVQNVLAEIRALAQ